MSETTPGTDTRSTYRITHNPQQGSQPHSTEHTAGTSTCPPRPKRNHHRGSNPSRRPPVSQAQREKLSAAQRAYVATDPRWAAHCQSSRGLRPSDVDVRFISGGLTCDPGSARTNSFSRQWVKDTCAGRLPVDGAAAGGDDEYRDARVQT